jgi:nucleoside-diphosphate-sugar epimerase
MRVLIIGGTGLISTAITRMLCERGDDVVLYNRGKTVGTERAEVEAIAGDRTDRERFASQMADAGAFDCAIDMACYEPDDAACAARVFAARARQYVFCSTVDVYTKTTARYPVAEDAPREPSPSFPYAHKKAACERILEDARDREGLALTILRPAYTYGEGRGPLYSYGDWSHCLARTRAGRPIIVHGDGSSIWPACHRDDVARAFVAAAGNERATGRAYNVTGEEWMTWNQYHARIAEALGAPEPRLVHVPTDLLARLDPRGATWCRENFQYDNIFDNAAARSDLDFAYTVPWVDGARRVVAWLDEHGRRADGDEPTMYGKILQTWERLCDDAAAKVGRES